VAKILVKLLLIAVSTTRNCFQRVHRGHPAQGVASNSARGSGAQAAPPEPVAPDGLPALTAKSQPASTTARQLVDGPMPVKTPGR